MMNSGEYGGRVLRNFKGDGLAFVSGAILTPEDVAAWPIGNRRALFMEGKVEWFGPPAEDETIVREAGKPAAAKGKAAEKKETPAKTASQPANRRARSK